MNSVPTPSPQLLSQLQQLVADTPGLQCALEQAPGIDATVDILVTAARARGLELDRAALAACFAPPPADVLDDHVLDGVAGGYGPARPASTYWTALTMECVGNPGAVGPGVAPF